MASLECLDDEALHYAPGVMSRTLDTSEIHVARYCVSSNPCERLPRVRQQLGLHCMANPLLPACMMHLQVITTIYRSEIHPP